MIYCSSWLLQVRAVIFCYWEIGSLFLKNWKKFVKQSHDDSTQTIIYFKCPLTKLSSQPLTRKKENKKKILFHRIYYPHSFNNQQSTINYSQHQPRFNLIIKLTLLKVFISHISNCHDNNYPSSNHSDIFSMIKLPTTNDDNSVENHLMISPSKS